jgi:RNA polymerase sigma factor (TIGR02999 family)
MTFKHYRNLKTNTMSVRPPQLKNSLTTMLDAWQTSHHGMHDSAFHTLIDACYEQLRRLAAERLRESGAISLSPTDLLHDAIIYIGESHAAIKNTDHFLATMSLKMRSLLIDHARTKLADKHGGDLIRITLTDANVAVSDITFELIALDAAFNLLDETEPRCAQVMHLTYFAGMKRADIAKLLDVSLFTVDADLRFGHAFAMESLDDA